jgi:hypothetical protein
MADWDVIGAAPAQIQNPWAVRSMVPAPAPETGVGDVVKGVGDAALSGASKVATGITGGVLGLVNRLVAAASGGDPEMAAQVTKEYVNQHYGHDTATPVGQKIGGAVSSALAPLGRSAQADEDLLAQGGEKIGIPQGETRGALHEVGELANVAPLVGGVARGAQASNEAATLAAQNAPGWAKLGYRSAADHPMAAGAAGNTGTQALVGQNQQVSNVAHRAVAGLAPDADLTKPGAFATGREAPNAVYNRAAASVPEGPLTPTAASMVDAIGNDANRITKPSPDVATRVADMKAALLAPGRNFTGNQIINESRGLRADGFANTAVENDVDKNYLGRQQLAAANALDQHVADSLPQNGIVSQEQLQQARVALAQNHAVEAATIGNNVSLQALGRMKTNGAPLTGVLSDSADFANAHPGVSGLGSRIEVPPSFKKDVGTAMAASTPGAPQDILGRLFGATGVSAAARRVLTGNPTNALSAAGKVPITGLGGEFNQLSPGPLSLQPSPGRAFEPHQPDLATGNPENANLQMQQPEGKAFEQGQRDLFAPDVTPVDRLERRPSPLGSNPTEVTPVAPARTYGGQPANNDLGATFIHNNDSAASGGASTEAQHTPNRNLQMVDQDGRGERIMSGVNQKDIEPLSNRHIIVDADTKQIVKSGNMKPNLAQGLLNRWKAGLANQF